MSAIVVDKDKKRKHILISAIDIFSSKGFAKATINDIAASAGIGKGTVYEYFKNKDEIIHQAFRYFMNAITGGFEEILLSTMSAREKLALVLESFCTITDGESGKLLDIMMDFWAEGLRSDQAKGILNREMKAMYTAYRELIKDILEQGVEEEQFKKDMDTYSVSCGIIGMLDGVMVQWLLDKENINVKTTMESFVEMIFNGIENKQEEI